jgi:hypothetical protein
MAMTIFMVTLFYGVKDNYSLGNSKGAFLHPSVFLKRLDVFFKRRHLFFKDGYLFKKDGVLLGELLRCLKIKSWNFTLHTLHASRKTVNGEGCEG